MPGDIDFANLIELDPFMTWKCPDCGVEGLDDSLLSHAIDLGGCGYVKFPLGVVLRCETTGKEIPFRIPTVVGNAILKSIFSEDIRYVSKEQFALERSVDKGGWVIKHLASATNVTFLNGSEISEDEVLLKTGDVISIKDKYLHLSVRLQN